jgi:hypothetical protein
VLFIALQFAYHGWTLQGALHYKRTVCDLIPRGLLPSGQVSPAMGVHTIEVCPSGLPTIC